MATADYRYWDRARRAKARGLEISGLLLKPLASKVAAWTLGDMPEWSVSVGAGNQRLHRAVPDLASTALNHWWASNHAEILRGYEEALALGDCYLVINADLSVTVVPPHVVDPLLDARGEVAGWRITESYLTPNPSPLHGEGRRPPLCGACPRPSLKSGRGRGWGRT